MEGYKILMSNRNKHGGGVPRKIMGQCTSFSPKTNLDRLLLQARGTDVEYLNDLCELIDSCKCDL